MTAAGLQTPVNTHTTREGWLMAAKEALAKSYFDTELTKLPPRIQCSCGWCKYNARAIGQCWDTTATKDETTHIFICPTLDDQVTILATLLHELVHAQVGVKEKHGKVFRARVRELGLVGRATATYAEPGTPLHADLVLLAEGLGPYPHSAMAPKRKLVQRKQWLRLKSINEDEYRVVISPAMREEHGAPVDPWGDEMVPVHDRGGEDE